MRLIVGLGNPGPEYAGTRHNVGFRAADVLSRRHSIPFTERRKLAYVGLGRIGGEEVALAKPRTYMNNSGEAVKQLVGRFRLKPQDIIILYDEMDLPVGKIRVRPGGSAAGHNGIISIIGALGTQEFPRVRIGIGRATPGGSIGYVLGGFAASEREAIEEAVQRAADAVEAILEAGLEKAMNKCN